MDKKEQILWDAYDLNRSIENRNKLVEYYLPLTEKIASKLSVKASGFHNRSEVLSYLYEGLLINIDTYDKTRSDNPGPYLAQKMKYHYLDSARDGLPKGRHHYNQKRIVDDVNDRFAKQGIHPSTQECIDLLKSLVDEGKPIYGGRDRLMTAALVNSPGFYDRTALTQLSDYSINSGADDYNHNAFYMEDHLNGPDKIEKNLLAHDVLDCLLDAAGLSERDMHILVLRYYHGLKLLEIMKIVGGSQAAISLTCTAGLKVWKACVARKEGIPLDDM